MFKYRIALTWAICATLAAVSPSFSTTAVPGPAPVCTSTDLLGLVVDSTSGLPTQCTMPAGDVLVETLYYQNASRVGQSALAAYPMARVLAGVGSRSQLVMDLPSQIAESGPGGTGLYLRTSPGIGGNYAIADTSRVSLGVGLEDHPPISPYATSPVQSLYDFDVTSLYKLTSSLAVDGSLTDARPQYRGSRLLPTMDLGMNYQFAQSTTVAMDLGTRHLARHDRQQPFSDVSVTHALGKDVAIDTGLGTTFKPISNSKSHYLSAGLDLLR